MAAQQFQLREDYYLEWAHFKIKKKGGCRITGGKYSVNVLLNVQWSNQDQNVLFGCFVLRINLFIQNNFQNHTL